MKVKLLKKARKRFIITYYPLGSAEFGSDYKYSLEDSEFIYKKSLYKTKEEVFKAVIYSLRFDYFKYTRKYKKSEVINF